MAADDLICHGFARIGQLDRVTGVVNDQPLSRKLTQRAGHGGQFYSQFFCDFFDMCVTIHRGQFSDRLQIIFHAFSQVHFVSSIQLF